MLVCKERQRFPDYFSLWLRGPTVSILAATGRSSAHALRKVVADQMSSITELLSNGNPSTSLLARDGPSPTHSREMSRKRSAFAVYKELEVSPQEALYSNTKNTSHTCAQASQMLSVRWF